MVTLIIGKKGAGKTKKLIEYANKALENSKGNVVVVEKGKKLTFDISHTARLINIDDYRIIGKDALNGFLNGICAGNYDVTDLLVDSTLTIMGGNTKDLLDFVTGMKTLSEQANINIILSVSADTSDIPAEVLSISEQI